MSDSEATVSRLSDRRPDPPPAPPRRPKGGGGKGGEEARPPLWRWFTQQIHHSDADRAAAAAHVRSRWDMPTASFRRIDRALETEASEHLTPYRLLLDEYRLTFQIEDADEAFARETGMAGLLVPFAPEQCEKCKRDAVPGTGACGIHGGQWISPQDQAALSHRLHDKLLTMSEAALRTLGDLMDNAKSEQVRMMAATSILDRAGIGPHMNVNHSGEITVTDRDRAAMELQARLDRIAANTVAKAEMQARIEAGESAAEEEEIEDAEVVDEVGF